MVRAGRRSRPKPDGYQRTKTVYIRPEDWPYWAEAIELSEQSGGALSLSEIVGRGIRRAVGDLRRRGRHDDG